MLKRKKIYCNRCKKPIRQKRDGTGPEYFHVEKWWGYFSKKDLEVHEWNLCEDCYDRILEEFAIPASVRIEESFDPFH